MFYPAKIFIINFVRFMYLTKHNKASFLSCGIMFSAIIHENITRAFPKK